MYDRSSGVCGHGARSAWGSCLTSFSETLTMVFATLARLAACVGEARTIFALTCVIMSWSRFTGCDPSRGTKAAPVLITASTAMIAQRDLSMQSGTLLPGPIPSDFKCAASRAEKSLNWTYVKLSSQEHTAIEVGLERSCCSMSVSIKSSTGSATGLLFHCAICCKSSGQHNSASRGL